MNKIILFIDKFIMSEYDIEGCCASDTKLGEDDIAFIINSEDIKFLHKSEVKNVILYKILYARSIEIIN